VVESTKVFVHGNPETSAIWSLLVNELHKNGVNKIVLLTPPGFGAPTPKGWGATVAEYRDWLLGELDKIDTPIDLVGHDWGAGHVFGVLAARPNFMRTWATDCGGLIHPDYQWHDAAQGWQAPDIGEKMVAGMVAMSAEQFADYFSSLGMTREIAAQVKKDVNDEFARCILGLYRDAAQPAMAKLGELFAAANPPNGLVIIADKDKYAGSAEQVHQVAAGVNAKVANIPDAGHWWMIERPALAASILIEHWKSFNN
jgi:pimeloyl-ACP methyl ester carboxylesterase